MRVAGRFVSVTQRMEGGGLKGAGGGSAGRGLEKGRKSHGKCLTATFGS